MIINNLQDKELLKEYERVFNQLKIYSNELEEVKESEIKAMLFYGLYVDFESTKKHLIEKIKDKTNELIDIKTKLYNEVDYD